MSIQPNIKRVCFCVQLWFIFLTAVSSIAQTFSGIVTDSQNAPIQNAEITLLERMTIFERTATDAHGQFSIYKNITPNSSLRVKARGFSDFSQVLSIDLNGPLKIRLLPATVREDVTVSITRIESRLSETPASIVVLDREDLNTTAAQTVDDSLRQIAGFTLFRRSSSKTSNPTTQGSNLRGLGGTGASRAAVLLDGLSLNDAFGTWTYWSRVPRSAVEQVEVLRGGASALYGTSALSGAVNIVTSIAEKDRPILRFETSGGTQETFDGNIFASYTKNGWSIDAAADTFRTGGYIPISEAERGSADTNANSRHNNGFVTLARAFGSEPAASAGGLTRNYNARVFVRGNLFAERRDNGTALTNNRTYFRQAAAGADFSGNRFGTFQLRSFLETQVYDQTFSAISNNRNTEFLSRLQRVASQAFGASLLWSKPFGDHILTAEVETREVRGFSDETIFINNLAASLVGSGGRERTFSVFVQDALRIGRKLNLHFGGRFDNWNNFAALSSTRSFTTNITAVTGFSDRWENAFSPRIAAIYQLNNNFSLIASYARSFRAPTLNELYRAFRVGNVLTIANENLKAERSGTFETGVNFTGFDRKFTVRGNIFTTEVSRPVVSITAATTASLITRQRQNVGKTRSTGFEFDAEFLVRSNLKLSGGYLFVDSTFIDFPANPDLVGNFLPQVARQQLTFQTLYSPKKFSLGMQGRISGSQFEDDLNSLKLRPYLTVDLFASYQLLDKLQIFAAAENIFNSRYDVGLTPNLTVAAPRFSRVGLRFNLTNK